jgi:hypothetical protein
LAAGDRHFDLASFIEGILRQSCAFRAPNISLQVLEIVQETAKAIEVAAAKTRGGPSQPAPVELRHWFEEENGTLRETQHVLHRAGEDPRHLLQGVT